MSSLSYQSFYHEYALHETLQNTVECCNSAVQHNMILNMVQGVQFMRTMRTRDGGRKMIGGAEMVPLNPFQ